MKITISTGGINWTQYRELDLDQESLTAKSLRSYRLHNWKVEQGGEDHPNDAIRAKEFTPTLRTADWHKAGKPGGLRGLKENFRIERPSTKILIGDHTYTLA